MEKPATITPASGSAENAGMVRKPNAGGPSALGPEQTPLSRPQLNEPALKDTPNCSAPDGGCALMRTDVVTETYIYAEYT